MYDHALAAALVIAGEMDKGLDKRELMSLLVFAILSALESYDDERAKRLEASAN